ncbi:hypothetical protein NDU88_003817 [Pleurodeles waltl]|uniref:Uncharacterized protein n=1 Tax=Pleurodeles waltl TaxID=8319 RepID=A0AAV7WU32_PLEWA|nr:hypothetical protein NDU88_003817 [Pleurodeles waltl]
MEDSSRRDNIRLHGIPENEEGADMQYFLSTALPKLTSLDFNPPIEFHWAHRVGPKRSGNPSRPRPIIVCLQRHNQTRQILQAARKHGPFQMDQHDIRITADYSKEINDRKKAFLALRPRMRQLEIKYGLFDPARIPSDAAACAAAATSNPEGDGFVVNPLPLPGPTEQRRRWRTLEPFKPGRARTSREGASGVGERSSIDGELGEQQRSEQETGGAVEQAESGPEESQVVSAARESPGELPSHTSGEAWPFQVRPLCWVGKGKGEGAGQDGREE